ncbi:MAG: ubiquinol-cytochrome C chaperone family protein [Alphaproteobacteria bacterium]|nr:ubiquinol-cytochrome C chaperone family protein [Alphaproteobacteria bacterium]
MLGALRQLFIPKPPAGVEATYIALLAAARNPFFYEDLGVPDTLDGRFELIVLHLFLLQHRLVEPRADTTTTAFAQFLSEAFFNDMDNSLRELGVADTGVSKRIKKMGAAYHGRLQAYSAGLADATVLRAALARNLYGTVAQGDVALLDRLGRYVETMAARLAQSEVDVILRGAYVWPDAATLGL